MHHCHHWPGQLHQYRPSQQPRGRLEWLCCGGGEHCPLGHGSLEGWGRQMQGMVHDDSVRGLGFQHRRRQCRVYRPHSLSCFSISGKRQLHHSVQRPRRDRTETSRSFRTIRQDAWVAARRYRGCCPSIHSRHRWVRNNHQTGNEWSPQRQQPQLQFLYRIWRHDVDV